jgi:hypothetical protein
MKGCCGVAAERLLNEACIGSSTDGIGLHTSDRATMAPYGIRPMQSERVAPADEACAVRRARRMGRVGSSAYERAVFKY